ncbi:similar to Kazachstania africana KAFR_0G02900 hypothetical protein [Maudiozyma barnettii]|uniref:Uncharacterized protein n=1 Tax=Maudiozyma barnettii TaxID=61262 RepID=A0A8H2ZM41_9SACH|nr:uncharacterized protein KABA2_11S01672 [Kazachstania barnettii]CAB4256717.1 similar to Kazachstania africana KAFR_0G02900 hypothetical protein [Kazachstania barnettii]CAD1785373.1 similar to Kazachstania africana KAFR_0G02900 hypothetical protein [Kazachstania barnettii]
MNVSTNLPFNAAAVDYTELNLSIVLNIITLTSTFITCSAAPLSGFAAGSCIFNTLALISSLMLNILIGIDNSLPEGGSVGDLFTKIGDELGSKLGNSETPLFKNTIKKMGSIGDIFEYEVTEDGLRCVSVQIGKLGSNILPAVRESVCITPVGLELVTKPHKVSVKSMVSTLRQKLNSKEENGYTQEVASAYAKYGTLGSVIIDKLGELHNMFSANKLSGANTTVSVNVEHDNELMLQIALKLI